MLHSSASRFSTGVPVSADAPARAGSARAAWAAGCAAFLMFWASSRTTALPLDRRQRRLVAVQQRIGADHHVVLRAARAANSVLSRAPRRGGPAPAAPARTAPARAASCPPPTSGRPAASDHPARSRQRGLQPREAGRPAPWPPFARRRAAGADDADVADGERAARPCSSSAITWMVFPKPISSARQPPRP